VEIVLDHVVVQTSEALLGMRMELIKYCEIGEVDAAATVLEMAQTMVDLSYKLIAGTYTLEEYGEWQELVQA
jgi:hypothetical protein